MDILLFNPSAGAIAKSGLTPEHLIEMLGAKGVNAYIPHYITEDEMINVANKASGRIIVAGGDGTVHKILKAAAQCHAVSLAIIPIGTANHLANTLGIPQEIEAAIDIIAAGYTRHIDLGKVNGTVFSQAAGAGLHARVFHTYGEHEEKSAIDAASAAFKTWTDWEPQLLHIVIDGEPYIDEITQVTAANTPIYGRSFNIAPEARIDDGLLDVVILGKLSKFELVEYGLAIMAGRAADLPKTYTTRARKIEINSVLDEPVEVHADAEPVGHTPAVIEVLPGCLEVTVPKGSP